MLLLPVNRQRHKVFMFDRINLLVEICSDQNKRRMRNIIVLTFGLIATMAFGQQEPQFSQYNRNQYLVNPGAAGAYDFVDITLGGRMQWAGFKNAPMSTYLYGSTALPRKNKAKYYPRTRTRRGPIRYPKRGVGGMKHAFGGYLLADQYGAFRQIKFAGTYAIHLPLSQRLNLSFGVDLGLSNRAFIKERAQTLNVMTGVGTDATYAQYSTSVSDYTMDVGAGLYLYSEDFYLGLSADQLTGELVRFGLGTVDFEPRMHFRGTVGYKIHAGDNVTITPNALVKYVISTPISIEGGLQFEFQERFWIAASYRSSKTIVGMLGFNINEVFKMGYSYDFTTSAIKNNSVGSHELVLGIMIGR